MAQFDPKKMADAGDKKGKKEDKKPKEEKKPKEKKKEEPEPMDDEPKPIKQKDPFETIPKVTTHSHTGYADLTTFDLYDDFLVRMMFFL